MSSLHKVITTAMHYVFLKSAKNKKNSNNKSGRFERVVYVSEVDAGTGR